jgi:hypothetical protein
VREARRVERKQERDAAKSGPGPATKPAAASVPGPSLR